MAIIQEPRDHAAGHSVNFTLFHLVPRRLEAPPFIAIDCDGRHESCVRLSPPMMRTSAKRGRSDTGRSAGTFVLRGAILAVPTWVALTQSSPGEASPEAHGDAATAPMASVAPTTSTPIDAPLSTSAGPSPTPPPSASSNSSENASPGGANGAPAAPVAIARGTDASTAPAQENTHTKLPPFPPNGTRAFVTVAPLGACTRIDDNVGKSGFCEELLGGTDTTFAPRWHFDWEAGLGYMDAAIWGFRDLGFSQRSGGPYFVARVFVGYDLSSLFVARLGVQTRVGDSFGNLDPGVQGVLDLGTRCWTRFEVGLRTFAGVDGVITSGGVDDSWYSMSLAYGTSLFGRYLFP